MRIHTLGFIAAAVLAALVPLATANEFYLKIIFTAAMYYVAASGLNVLVGWSGQKSLGHAGLFAAGAYTAALLTAQAGWNPWAALLAAAVVAGLFGVLIALPSLRVKGPSLAMVTIGFGIVVEKVLTEWQEPFGGQQGIYGVLPLTLGGRPLDMRGWAWVMLAFAFATHLMLRTLLGGRLGRAFKAVNTSEVAAESVGIPVYRTKVLAFVISAVTCGVAGGLMAQQNQYVNSDFITFNLSIFLLLLALLGGPPVIGPALGAIVLTLLDAFLARWPGLQHFSYGALLLFALYAMPQGLAGASSGVVRRWWPRWQRIQPLPGAAGDWQPAVPVSTKSSAVLLRATGLFKAYGGVVPTRDVDVLLRPGHVHALIGPNGAGKTTLLNMLSGIVKADKGRIEFDGIDISRLSANRICGLGIARTFQNLRLFSGMSVFDNVMVALDARISAPKPTTDGSHPPRGLRSLAEPVLLKSPGFIAQLLGLPAVRRQEQAAREEATRLLRLLGLQDRAHEVATSLPYGLQRRLELARALATRPRLLMLDEPAAGLNPQETAELTALIRRIGQMGITVLLIEHHMDLVMAVSDHVMVLDHGVKIAEGTPREVRNDAQVIAAYLGVDDDDDEAERAAALSQKEAGYV